MRKEDMRICVIRVAGTNCDSETQRAFLDMGVNAEVVHLIELMKRGILDYHVLVFPGGFSYGDYLRAGSIWARRFMVGLENDLRRFVDQGRPILGICNGFQVLVELGLLPGFDGLGSSSQAALTTNVSASYECRWIHLRHENSGNCIFTSKIAKDAVLSIPVAHGEGRFIFPREKEAEYRKRLYEEDQLVFRYCEQEGDYAEGRYPLNPNGSFHDIAGICDAGGTIFGLMPHPERAYYGWQIPDWRSCTDISRYGDGRIVFESLIEYLERRF